MSLLFLTYDSLLSPLLQSQGLPHLRRLAKAGARVAILSFEEAGARTEELAVELGAEGITWLPVARWRGRLGPLPASLPDLARGVALTWRLARKMRARILHGRSFRATLWAVLVAPLIGAKVVFDVRDLLAEDYASKGYISRGGFKFRLIKALEAFLLRRSDAIVVTSEPFRELVLSFPYAAGTASKLHVVPNCADTERFQPGGAIRARPLFVFAGSVAPWRMIGDVARIWNAYRAEVADADLAIYSYAYGENVMGMLRDAGIADPAGIALGCVPFEEIPARFAGASAGFELIVPEDRYWASPIKVAQFLAAGVPVVVNAGLRFPAQLVAAHRVGVIVPDRDIDHAEAARELGALLAEGPALKARCRQVAETYLSLDVAIAEYRRIYDALGGLTGLPAASASDAESASTMRPAALPPPK